MVELVNTNYPTSPHFKDRSGQIINGIEIVKFLGQDKNFNSVYLCKCPVCGELWDARINGIISGSVKSCGCSTARTDRSISKWEDHLGETHNDLTIIGFERVFSGSRYRPHFICRCKCDNVVSVRVQQVLEGKTVSCGCKTREVNRERLLGTGRHNQHYRSKLYGVYTRMRRCCTDVTDDNYKNYGGRGIYVCDEWLDYENGFNRFYEWAQENGYEEGLTIDRIDNDGPYAPWNCRWVTMKVQSVNKSTNRYVTYEQRFDEIGKPPIRYTFTISIWGEITGFGKNVIRDRLYKTKMSVEDTLTKVPTNKCRNHNERRMLVIPSEYLQFNRPDKYDESIHD